MHNKDIRTGIRQLLRLSTVALILLSLGTPLTLTTPFTDTIQAANTCNDVVSGIPSWIVNQVNYNKPFYQATSNTTAVPWEMLAAIHYRETNFSHSNPANGQGIFQFVNGDGGPYPPGPVSDTNFQQQLNYMASRIQADYVYRGSLAYAHRPLRQSEPDDFRVQDTLYSYNGRSSQYAQQGVQYGFNATTQPYEGSPYVMNMFDCARANMGLITRDYGNIDGIDTRYGTYTLYTRLKSDNYWQTRYDYLGTNTRLNLPGCNEATNTTLTCVWTLQQLSTNYPTVASSIEVRDQLIAYGYKLSGVGFFGNVPNAPQRGNIPVYQLVAPDYSIFLTTNANEMNTLASSHGYTILGIGFYANPPYANSGYDVTRLYSPSTGNHMWLPSTYNKSTYLNSGYIDEGVVFNSISSVRQEDPAPTGRSLVYRFYIPQTRSHFWTTQLSERDSMIKAGYQYEGIAWQGYSGNANKPIYRLYAPSLQQHLYTADAYERSILAVSGGWIDEGVAFYVSKLWTPQAVYRLYSPILHSHQLTMDLNERSILINNGWQDEGVAWHTP